MMQSGGQANRLFQLITLILRLFFRSVQTDIIKADKLRVLDMEWLAQGEFRIRIETLLASFKATGGEVLYKNNSTEEVRRAI
jgi:hypothetical protein